MAALFMALVAGAIAGVVYVRVQHGPISMKPLAGMIEKEINGELSGLVARIEDVEIAYENGGLELRLSNLQLSEPDGDVVLSVPAAAVEMSGRAMRSFRLVPSRIDLIEPRVSLVYRDVGGLKLSIDGGGRKRDGRLGAGGTEANTSGAAAAAAIPQASAGERLDVAEVMAAIGERVRKGNAPAQHLREIGVKDAVISVDNQGALSEWRILEGSIDLGKAKDKVLASGQARIGSSRGSWTVGIEASTGPTIGSVSLTAEVRDLHPRVLGVAMPQLAVLEPFDAPVAGVIKVTVAPDATISSAEIDFECARGALAMPAIADKPLLIDGAALRASYSAERRRLDLHSAVLGWGSSRFSLTGAAVGEPDSGVWRIRLNSDRGQLGAEEFGIAPVALSGGRLEGRYLPATKPGSGAEIAFDKITLDAGGAELSATGGARFAAPSGGPDTSGVMFEAKLGPMTADRLKTLWPRGIASGARTWVGERIKRGTVKGGTIRYFRGSFAREAGVPPGVEPRRLSLALEAADVTGVPLGWLSPIEAPRILVRLEDHAIEVNIPDAHVALGQGRRVPIKGGRFAAAELNRDAPLGEVTMRATSGLVPMLEILDQSPLRLLRQNGISTDGVDGKVDGQLKLSFPLIADLLARDVQIEAKARVTDGRVKQLGGAYDVQGGTIAIDVTPSAVDAKGDLLANGVPVKLAWQRILEDNGEKQPPLRLSASLDNADRDQLGLDINHILQGEVPVEILVEKGAGDQPSVTLRADLTNAEIAFESIAWRKARGRQATLQADIVRGKAFKVELQNLRLAGDDIAMEGSAGIGSDNRLREIDLKELTLNVISRLEVQAALKTGGSDKAGVWQVKVKGRTFDARELFRSIMSVSSAPEKPVKGQKSSAAMDLEADIDNVLGHNDVAIRGFKMKLTRRGDKLATLDARGTLDGGQPVAVSMSAPQGSNPRVLQAETADAGQAFRLIGFYPKMQSGRARLQLNVDGSGAAEKTGTLWVEDFRILGDFVVSDVTGGPPGSPDRAVQKRRKSEPQRESFEFSQMKVPFSVGHGQFVLQNAQLRNPVQGVVLTGKIDLKNQTLNLGGMFIPLSALGDVPLLGELLPNGSLGFSVQGPVAQPQVIVNPLTMVVPGPIRDLMQMTNPNPRVVPREEQTPASTPAEKRTRAAPPTPAPQARSNEPARGKAGVQTGGAWSSEVSPGVPPVPPQPQPAKRPQKKPLPAETEAGAPSPQPVRAKPGVQ